jgi:hypothetical protein
MYGTVKRRKRDSDGELIGKSHKNPLLDTAVYEVEFDSGDTEAYHANVIAESIYAQTDNDGYTTYLLKEIVDHRSSKRIKWAKLDLSNFVRANWKRWPGSVPRKLQVCRDR